MLNKHTKEETIPTPQRCVVCDHRLHQLEFLLRFASKNVANTQRTSRTQSRIPPLDCTQEMNTKTRRKWLVPKLIAAGSYRSFIADLD